MSQDPVVEQIEERYRDVIGVFKGVYGDPEKNKLQLPFTNRRLCYPFDKLFVDLCLLTSGRSDGEKRVLIEPEALFPAVIADNSGGAAGGDYEGSCDLITGVAGVGKTTLCHYMLYKHASNKPTDKLWNDRFDLLIYVPLRNLVSFFDNKESAYSLKELICAENDWLDFSLLGCRGGHSAHLMSPERKEALWQFISHNNHRVLFLLDGLDEVRQGEEEHAVVQAFLGEHSKQLNCIITSRPQVVSPNIRGRINRRIENTGFSVANRAVYVNTYFALVGKPDNARLILDWMARYSHMSEFLTVPLNGQLLCAAWAESDYTAEQGLPENPSTTQLYAFLMSQWRRRAIPKLADKLDVASRLHKRKIRKRLEHILLLTQQVVEVFAAELVSRGKTTFVGCDIKAHLTRMLPIFREGDTQDVFPLDEEGLLQCIFTLGVIKPREMNTNWLKDTYEPVHKTFLEYLAARGIGRVMTGNKMADTYLHTLSIVEKNFYNPQYRRVWPFVTGYIARERSAKLDQWMRLLQREIEKDMWGSGSLTQLLACMVEVGEQSPRRSMPGGGGAAAGADMPRVFTQDFKFSVMSVLWKFHVVHINQGMVRDSDEVFPGILARVWGTAYRQLNEARQLKLRQEMDASAEGPSPIIAAAKKRAFLIMGESDVGLGVSVYHITEDDMVRPHQYGALDFLQINKRNSLPINLLSGAEELAKRVVGEGVANGGGGTAEELAISRIGRRSLQVAALSRLEAAIPYLSPEEVFALFQAQIKGPLQLIVRSDASVPGVKQVIDLALACIHCRLSGEHLHEIYTQVIIEKDEQHPAVRALVFICRSKLGSLEPGEGDKLWEDLIACRFNLSDKLLRYSFVALRQYFSEQYKDRMTGFVLDSLSSAKESNVILGLSVLAACLKVEGGEGVWAACSDKVLILKGSESLQIRKALLAVFVEAVRLYKETEQIADIEAYAFGCIKMGRTLLLENSLCVFQALVDISDIKNSLYIAYYEKHVVRFVRAAQTEIQVAALRVKSAMLKWCEPERAKEVFYETLMPMLQTSQAIGVGVADVLDETFRHMRRDSIAAVMEFLDHSLAQLESPDNYNLLVAWHVSRSVYTRKLSLFEMLTLNARPALYMMQVKEKLMHFDLPAAFSFDQTSGVCGIAVAEEGGQVYLKDGRGVYVKNYKDLLSTLRPSGFDEVVEQLQYAVSGPPEGSLAANGVFRQVPRHEAGRSLFNGACPINADSCSVTIVKNDKLHYYLIFEHMSGDGERVIIEEAHLVNDRSVPAQPDRVSIILRSLGSSEEDAVFIGKLSGKRHQTWGIKKCEYEAFKFWIEEVDQPKGSAHQIVYSLQDGGRDLDSAAVVRHNCLTWVLSVLNREMPELLADGEPQWTGLKLNMKARIEALIEQRAADIVAGPRRGCCVI
jgi:hypothetical protein